MLPDGEFMNMNNKLKIALALITTLITMTGFAQTQKITSRLSQYSATSEVIQLQNFGGDLSGVTYNYDTDTYFVIQNNAAIITELTNDFKKVLRRITLKNPQDNDTEDIVYLGNSEFAISAEKVNVVTILTIKEKETVIDLNSLANKNVQRMYLPPQTKKGNKGLEGICFTKTLGAGQGAFFAVQEDKPKRLFTWNRPITKNHITNTNLLGLKEPINIEKHYRSLLNDLSGCTFDDLSGNLILLSHESSRAVEFNAQGAVVNKLELPSVAPQYEGITIGRDNELILASEPNIIVIMKSTAVSSPTTAVK